MTLDVWRERLKEYEADRAAYAEKIKVELLFGLRKPRFHNGAKPAPTKCNSCGSQEFVQHRERRICAFCRQ